MLWKDFTFTWRWIEVKTKTYLEVNSWYIYSWYLYYIYKSVPLRQKKVQNINSNMKRIWLSVKESVALIPEQRVAQREVEFWDESHLYRGGPDQLSAHPICSSQHMYSRWLAESISSRIVGFWCSVTNCKAYCLQYRLYGTATKKMFNLNSTKRKQTRRNWGTFCKTIDLDSK